MKTPKSLLLIAFIAFFTACSNKNEVFIGDWEGEYVATDMLEFLSADGNVTESNTHNTEITIFRDNGLYVQTLGIGDPFDPGKDPVNHTIMVKAPSRLKCGILDEIEEGDPEEGESGIENVEVTPKNVMVLINGGVFTVYNGRVYSSKAIKALSSSENQLILYPGQLFEIALTNANGDNIETVTCNWTYTPIKKTDDTYSWTAELHISSKSSTPSSTVSTMRHTITMTKK